MGHEDMILLNSRIEVHLHHFIGTIPGLLLVSCFILKTHVLCFTFPVFVTYLQLSCCVFSPCALPPSVVSLLVSHHLTALFF